MKRFLGIEQKKKQRELKTWKEALVPQDQKKYNIKNDFDLSTENIIKTFGNYFNPKHK